MMSLFTCNPSPPKCQFLSLILGTPSLLPRRRHFWMVSLSKRFEDFCTFQQCCFFFAWVILKVLKYNIVFLIVQTIFVCFDDAIVAKTNKSVKTVYSIRMINTIWTFTFESFVIRLIFFSFTFPWVAIFCSETFHSKS